MQIRTSRFGPIEFDNECVIDLPQGVVGLETCRRWVLVEEGGTSAVAWLQSLDRPELALALVHPRRFLPDYQARVSRRDLRLLGLDDPSRLEVLAIVSGEAESLTLNLKAPLLLDLGRRRGGQVVAAGDLPVRHPLKGAAEPRKRIA